MVDPGPMPDLVLSALDFQTFHVVGAVRGMYSLLRPGLTEGGGWLLSLCCSLDVGYCLLSSFAGLLICPFLFI